MAYNPFAMQLLPIDFEPLNTSVARYEKNLAAEVSMPRPGAYKPQMAQILEMYALTDLIPGKKSSYLNNSELSSPNILLPRQRTESDSIADVVISALNKTNTPIIPTTKNYVGNISNTYH